MTAGWIDWRRDVRVDATKNLAYCCTATTVIYAALSYIFGYILAHKIVLHVDFGYQVEATRDSLQNCLPPKYQYLVNQETLTMLEEDLETAKRVRTAFVVVILLFSAAFICIVMGIPCCMLISEICGGWFRLRQCRISLFCKEFKENLLMYKIFN